jgi:hypothetical protein
MVRLDGVLVVEDELAAFGYDDDLALESQLSDLVEADFKQFGGLDCGDVFAHGVSWCVWFAVLVDEFNAVLAISRVAFRDGSI